MDAQNLTSLLNSVNNHPVINLDFNLQKLNAVVAFDAYPLVLRGIKLRQEFTFDMLATSVCDPAWNFCPDVERAFT